MGEHTVLRNFIRAKLAVNGDAAHTLTTGLLAPIARVNILSITHEYRDNSGGNTVGAALPVIARVEGSDDRKADVSIGAISLQPAGLRLRATEPHGFALARFTVAQMLRHSAQLDDYENDRRGMLLRFLLERPVVSSLERVREAIIQEPEDREELASRVLEIIGQSLVDMLLEQGAYDGTRQQLVAAWQQLLCDDDEASLDYSLGRDGANPLGAELWFMRLARTHSATEDAVPCSNQAADVHVLDTCVVPIMLAYFSSAVAQDVVNICNATAM